MLSVVALSTAGVHVASVVALVAVATLKLLFLNLSATVLPWVLVALEDAAVDSEADSTEVEAVSEAAVAGLAAALIVEVVADVSAIVATAHPTAHLQALAAADLEAAETEVVVSMTVAHAATLTLSLSLLEEVTVEATAVQSAVQSAVATVVEIVAVTVTAIATVTALALVGMLDRSDLTMVVGMTSRGRDAATKWLYHWAPDGLHSTTTTHATHRPALLATYDDRSLCLHDLNAVSRTVSRTTSSG